MIEWFVEIIEYETEKVIETRGPFSEWKANKVDDRLNINLDHNKYYTLIKEVETKN